MNILLYPINVTRASLDFNRHVNNLEYLRWMQEAAIKHSTQLGWPPKRYVESGYSWVVGSHYIKYLRPAYEEDQLGIVTWVSKIKSRTIKRKYWCVDRVSKRVLVQAETLWVFVRTKTKKPCRIIDELRKDYIVEADIEAVQKFIAKMK